MQLQTLLSNISDIKDINDTKAFKQCVKQSYEWLEAEFPLVTEVDSLVTGRATFVDALLNHAWQLLQLDQEKGLALCAVGGYGRGQLQPHSDIDLLILSKKAISTEVQGSLSQFITLLWDIGLDIGQAVRTVKETISQAKGDITIATNLIESRKLIGCQACFDDLQHKMQGKGVWSSKDFFKAKHDEQKNRHAKFNGTSYNLEPNVKENPGCLRDIQSIGWVAKKHFSVWDGRGLVEHGYFTVEEFNELIECRSALWRLRFALHLEAGRGENRLLFDYQTDVAKRLGYGDDGKVAVERMMKAFFRVVRRVSELNEMLLQHFTQDILDVKARKKITIDEDFVLHDGLLTPTHDNVFPTPQSILQCLLTLAKHDNAIGLHSDCIRQLRNARRKFSSTYFCEYAPCRALFVELVKYPNFFSLGWDIMHKHGILQAYLPAWDHIVGQMQFDLFHAYTVDEHTHRLVKHVHNYTKKEDQDFPRCHRIMRNLDKPELLYLAAIFHDIGKGRNGDHSELGAVDALEFCQQHGYTQQEAELVSWLVSQHLLMSVVAQRRDIYDPEVITDFASKMKSHNHLNHLYALTLADIRATNDNLWNEWKSSLLRELYLLAQKALENGLQCEVTLQARVSRLKVQTKDMLIERFSEEAIEGLWSRMPSDYFARFKPEQLAWHAETILTQGTLEADELIVDATNNTSKTGTELMIYGKDQPRLFAQAASVLDSRNCNIHDAQIMSTHDGYILDSFVILEQNGKRLNSLSRLEGLKQAILTQFDKDEIKHTNNRKMSRQMRQLSVATKVRFYGSHNDNTLVELEALDSPGLLAKVGHLFGEQNLSLQMAKISTIGERAEDLFIVRNAENKALSQDEQVKLKQGLAKRLDDNDN